MPQRILIVDDDSQTRALVRLVLRRIGYDVVEAFDGLSALRMMEFTTPNLIIVDMMMPGIDGAEFCKRVRQQPQLAHIPIIAFSASSGSQMDRHTREAGFDAWLLKTSPPQDLMKLVQDLLSVQSGDLNN